jgi:hypothetical protein
MDTGIIKVCALLLLDHVTTGACRQIVGLMNTKHKSTFVGSIQSGLPFHKTILGDIQIPAEDLPKVVALLRERLVAFSDPQYRPVVRHASAIGIDHEGDTYLGIQLGFSPGSYVITGKKETDLEIMSELCPNFEFSLPHHITIGKVRGTGTDTEKEFARFAKRVKHESRVLQTAMFSPQIWVKYPVGWRPYYVPRT